MGLHMGVCHGPVDELMEIRGGDITLWSGQRYGTPTITTRLPRFLRPKDTTLPVTSTSPVTANETIRIYAPNAYGGDDREGGVDGTLDVMMGGSSQGANAYLASVQSGPQPGYRGFLSVVFRKGLVSANNPYVKPWAFRIKRILQGWDGGTVWYSAKASIDLGDGIIAMNPAHIVYECLTNRKWGLGLPASQLDLVAFQAAADTFHTEGMGLCIAWTRQERIDAFIQRVVDHVGAAVGEDPKTGIYRLKAIRNDYTVGSLPVFSFAAGNLVSVSGFQRSTITESKNEITVRFTDQKNAKTSSATVQNLAAIQPNGAPKSDTVEYLGLPTMDLATRVALRDLKAATVGLARCTLVVTRAGYNILPGDVIAFTWPQENIALMPMRVVTADYGSMTDGEITLEVVQDVFGLPATSYINRQDVSWVEPSRTPQASPTVRVFEMPYRDLCRTLTAQTAAALDTNAGFLASVAVVAPGMSYGYQLDTRTGAADYVMAQTGEWCPSGTLAALMPKQVTNTTVTVNGVVGLDQVGYGQVAMIDDELCNVVTYDPATGSVTLARGCGDSVPAEHASGARVWFYETFEAVDPTEWATSEVVDAKVRTITSETLLSIASSPGGAVTMNRRAYRPYPPGQFRVNGVYYPSTMPAINAASLSWVHRDRLLQQDQVVDTQASGIGPEAGTTYTAVLKNGSTLATLATISSIAGTSANFTVGQQGTALTLRLELYSVRGGLASLQTHTHNITRVDDLGNPITADYFLDGGASPPPATEGQFIPHTHDGTNHVGTRKYTSGGGAQSTHVWYSSNDGSSWTKNTNNIGFDVRRLAYGGGIYAAIGGGNWFGRSLSVSGTWSSAAKTSWPVLGLTGALTMRDIIWDGTRFVAVGERGVIVTSTDGVTWTEVASNTLQDDGTLLAIAFDGTTYVVALEDNITTPGTIVYRLFTSTDRATWTERSYPVDGSNPNGFYFTRIRFTNGRFVAMGSRIVSGNTRAALLESTTGTTWTARHPTAGSVATTAADCLYFSGRYVVGGGGFRAYSPDLSTWTMDEAVGRQASSFAANATALFGTKDYTLVGKTTDGITWNDHTL